MRVDLILKRGLLLPALLTLPLAGCVADNLGLDSVHQPLVGKKRARVEGCPDWRDQNKDSAASTMADYGCASNANLAAMVYDPADLLHGKSEAPSVEVGTRAIRAWRETQPTGKQQQITTSTSVGGGR